MTLPPLRAPLIAVSLCLAAPAHAVIVGGTNGDGFANATEAGLEIALASLSRPSFPFWDNLLRYSDASAIYLGRNSSATRGWVMSANHISETSSITVTGQSYNIIDPLPLDAGQNGHRIGTTDIVLYEIDLTTHGAPDLLAVPLASSAASAGEFLLMAGRGMRLGAGTGGEDTTAPYTWGTPGTTDANGIRWGTNFLDAANVDLGGGLGGIYLRTDFDESGAPPGDSPTPFDGQASLGDSGGSFFRLEGGQWVVGGVIYSVGDGPDGDGVANPAGYGDRSYATDARIFRTDILAITGTLVPEPSASTLLVFAASGLLWRRRRA